MKCYRLQPDSRFDTTIHYDHRWGLPGVKCTVCGVTWATTGLIYPSIDLSALANSDEYERARPEPLKEYLRLRDLVRPHVPTHLPLLPGTLFGPSVGRASGPRTDFSWCGSWACYVQTDAYGEMVASGLSLPPAVATEFKTRNKDLQTLAELHLEPQIPLVDDCLEVLGGLCPECGYQNTRWKGMIVVCRDHIPVNQDVFRVSNHSTIILGTDRLVQGITQLGLSGVSFEEVEVI
jgi:uncharacterized double-CXXCG motif protein